MKGLNIFHAHADNIFQQCSCLSCKMKEKTEYPAQKEQNEVHRISRQVILFNIFVSDMDSGIPCTLIRFVHDIKLCDVVDILEIKDSIQRDLARQLMWTSRSSTRQSIRSCTWIREILNRNMGWVENGLETALRRRTWGCWLLRNLWPNNVSL